jgi:AcrR family transcriptional regulator
VGRGRATSLAVQAETEPDVRPWRTGAPEPLDRRRRELFKLAAAVFREHGYRGATIKALAHACHLAPAGLYHYFASKADLGTYVIRQPHLDWRSVYIDPAVDPLRQLSGFLDLAILELPDFLLALDLAEELQLPGIVRLRRAAATTTQTGRPARSSGRRESRSSIDRRLPLVATGRVVGTPVPSSSRRRSTWVRRLPL